MEDYPRWMASAVEHALSVRRIVYVAGARQCGKTTLLRHLDLPGAQRRTLDRQQTRQAAFDGPDEFVERTGSGPLVIDEVQKVPDLFSAMKIKVDEDRSPGQYLITGSTNLKARPDVLESLAGRMRTIRLRPLSQGEVLCLRPTFLRDAFEGRFPSPAVPVRRDDLLDLAFRGGYPEAIALPARERPGWHRDYLQALLSRDIRDVMEIRNLPALRRMAVGLAGFSSKFLDKTGFASAYGVSKPTVDTYVAALEALYLFDQVPPWTPGDYDRAIRSPKWFAADTGTMVVLLRWNRAGIEDYPDRLGKLMETFVYDSLAATADLSDEYRIYHFRDRDKREIDFLVEDANGRMLGIEVKAGSAVRSDDFKHLDWFRERFQPDMVSIVLNTGTEPLSFGRGRHAVPITCLFGSPKTPFASDEPLPTEAGR